MNRHAIDVLDGDPLLTTREVAVLFRADIHTVQRWASAGLIPSCKTPGGARRYRKSVVTGLLDAPPPLPRPRKRPGPVYRGAR